MSEIVGVCESIVGNKMVICKQWNNNILCKFDDYLRNIYFKDGETCGLFSKFIGSYIGFYYTKGLIIARKLKNDVRLTLDDDDNELVTRASKNIKWLKDTVNKMNPEDVIILYGTDNYKQINISDIIIHNGKVEIKKQAN